MPSQRAHVPLITPEEYLRGEEVSPIRHEYIRGEVYAMAGATDAHVGIAMNLISLLRGALRGTGCRVYGMDMKVQVEAAGVYYYPDLFVTCDPRDTGSSPVKQHPRLIVEILSSRTEAFDRGAKFSDYQLLPSMEEYVLISQSERSVECLLRNAAGQFERRRFGSTGEVEFASIGFHCPIDAIYEDVSFED